MKFIKIILFVLIACACKNTGEDYSGCNAPDFYFKNAEKVDGTELDAEYIAKNPLRCYYTPFGFVGAMSMLNKKQIHLAAMETGRIIVSTCDFGRGPEEILVESPDMDMYGNSLYLLDQRTDRLKRVDIGKDTLLVHELMRVQANDLAIFLNVEVVSDSLYVFFTSDFDNNKSILLMDNYSQVLDSLSYKILNDDRIDQSKHRYNVQMKISPDRKILFISSMQFNKISKYHIKGNDIECIDEVFLTEPKYDIKGKVLAVKEDNIEMNARLFVGDKYVYLVVDPEYKRDFDKRRKHAQANNVRESKAPGNNSYIMVFNYNLEFIKTYICDYNIANLALCQEPDIVYATDAVNNCIVKYKLPGLN